MATNNELHKGESNGDGLVRETKTGTIEIIHDDDLEAWEAAQQG